jgi:ABC-2 type transport system permease protein
VFLLSGLLAWNFFAVSLQAGAQSVNDNANLVKKVAFPREILPLASVGVALFDLLLQSAVLWLFIVLSGHGLRLPDLSIYPLAVGVLVIFTTAATFWVAALNVRYRDVGHLLNLALLVWFWFTPIVYQGYLVQRELQGAAIAGVETWTLYLLNPMAIVVFGFQRALYGAAVAPGTDPVLPVVSLGWHAITLAGLLFVVAGLLAGAWRTFFHRSGDFAEEL